MDDGPAEISWESLEDMLDAIELGSEGFGVVKAVTRY
ncbi:hypothetical protein SLEP1_g49909 [Rubroshorea leprosula]|uniref:Uncharacterized protein n=1 Tax=Rubroshorea leprosula TaxID=152421 RepID=A0AAV5LYA6_9ROSI|nr:hypothetical protein SLEP1_g49909 [Rubroshorea leprosula]